MMGAYIDLPNETKEAFLEREADQVSNVTAESFGEYLSKGKLLVCLVANVAFTAAGIAFCRIELEEFLGVDGRPTKWYSIDYGKLPNHTRALLKSYLDDETRKALETFNGEGKAEA